MIVNVSFNPRLLAKIRTNERKMSSLLEYFSPRVQYIFEFTSKIRINEREISSLLEYFSKRVQVSKRFISKVMIICRCLRICKGFDLTIFYLFPCKKRAKAMRCAEFVSFLRKSAIFKLKYHIFATNVLIYEKSTYFIGDGIDIVFAVMWKH